MLFLNVDLTRTAAQNERAYSLHQQHPPLGYDVCWYACPKCYWVAAVYTHVPWNKGSNLLCPRPSDPAFRVATIFSKVACQEAVWLEELCPRITAAFSAALRLGGTNAVIDVLNGFSPTELGLPHAGIGIRGPRSFDELRPSSVRKPKTLRKR